MEFGTFSTLLVFIFLTVGVVYQTHRLIAEQKENVEFKRIALALTKLIRKANISGSNGRTVTLNRTMDVLGGVSSNSGIEKRVNDIEAVTEIRKKLEHLLTIDR